MIVREGILLGYLTDTGCQREENEDCCAYYEPEDEEVFARKGRILSVADGMGGHAEGALASRLAVETIGSVYLASEHADLQEALAEAFDAANRLIYQTAGSDPKLKGMGTTCTSLVLKGNKAYLGHIGDTRAYLIRSGSILQLTQDHSHVMRMVREGLLSEEQAKDHPHKHILERGLGTREKVTVDFAPEPIPIYNEDLFLLCSDGLHGLVSDEEMKQRALPGCHPHEMCWHLVDLAKARGGPDNITVAIVKVTTSS